MCALDIVEGLTFLIRFDNNEDLDNFKTVCAKEENTRVLETDIINTDDSDDEDDHRLHHIIEKKVAIKRHVKHIPLFIYNNANEKHCNALLTQHLRNILNFVSMRAIDHDELMDHDTTTWFTCRDSYKVRSYEELKHRFFENTKESQPNFVELLPINVVVNIKGLTYRCYDWLLNGAHEKLGESKHHTQLLEEYIRSLRWCNGEQIESTYTHFHSRKISVITCEGYYPSVNQVFDRLFQST